MNSNREGMIKLRNSPEHLLLKQEKENGRAAFSLTQNH